MGADFFRREALEHHARGHIEDPLLEIPRTTTWVYAAFAAALLTATTVLGCVPVTEYARGPAIVTAVDRVPIVAAQAGVVSAVAVRQGAQVAPGDLLVQFTAADEEAQLRSVQQEFDAALVGLLVNPSDHATRQTLASLRGEKERLAARVASRSIRASAAGIAGDVRVRTGQHLNSGDLLLTIEQERSRYAVIALLEGEQRPVLDGKRPLRIEIEGFRHAYQEAPIDRIDSDVVGPAEVRRLLGPGIGDTVTIRGPVVIVHASLPRQTFRAGDKEYRFHDGMPATAAAYVGTERLMNVMLPGLRSGTR